MSDQFENKKFLSVFCTSKDSPLTYAEILVYCYRANQHAYETIPSHRRTAKATGLKEETVASATTRLHQHGLLLADWLVIAPCPRITWFRQLDSLVERFPDKHFSMWLQNWRCYVRQPGADNPLTVPCVMLYSLIRHSVLNNWKPPAGWSQEYLSLITGINPKTVSTSLDKLEASGFITILDGMRFRLYKLRECQLTYFSDKRAWSGVGSAEPDEIVEDFSPASAAAEAIDNARSSLAQFLGKYPISDSDRHRIFRGIVDQTEWHKGNWQDVAQRAASRCMDAMEGKV